jgi:hypothetical protein
VEDNEKREVATMQSPQPGPVRLTIVNCQGIIRPAVVQVDDGTLTVVNETDAEATVVLPAGVSTVRALWRCPARGQVDIPVISKTEAKDQGLLGFQIPYGVYFYDPAGAGIRDWGVAGSPPAMKVGP